MRARGIPRGQKAKRWRNGDKIPMMAPGTEGELLHDMGLPWGVVENRQQVMPSGGRTPPNRGTEKTYGGRGATIGHGGHA